MSQSVDVIIAAWNRAATIERAMLSALDQADVRAVIVVDDCSTDDTESRARRIAVDYGERVVVGSLQINRGPAAARNVALELSTAPWVAILDGDDFFLPGRVGDLLLQAGDADFVADNLIQVREGHENVRQLKFVDKYGPPWRLSLEEFVLGNVSRRGHLRKELGFLKPVIRRSFLDLHQLRYDESLRLGEDYALYARALTLGARFLITSACGYVSVERSGSLSDRHTKQDLERLRDVDQGLTNIQRLTVRERSAIRRHYDSVDAKAQWIGVIDALKERSISRFVAPFFRSSTVSIFLVINLLEQLLLRSSRWLSNVCKETHVAFKRLLSNWWRKT